MKQGAGVCSRDWRSEFEQRVEAARIEQKTVLEATQRRRRRRRNASMTRAHTTLCFG
jgi:hypothetical protein